MTDVWIDFETYSELDIKQVGGYKYVHDDSTNVVCLGWAIDDGKVNIWTPRGYFPEELLEAVRNKAFVYAHNIKFDWRVWNKIMYKEFGWPRMDIEQCICSQGLCATYSLPLSLDKAGVAMEIEMQKSSTGKALIKLLCTPDKNGNQPMFNDPLYANRFLELYAYCKQDVRAMRELVGLLPKRKLIPREHDIWVMTQEMNSKGLPIAYDEATAIRTHLDDYIDKSMIQVPQLTNGAIDKVTQTVKIAKWVTEKGYPMDSVAADKVEEALEDPKCKGDVRKMLELRQELGKSSVAKFVTILSQACPDENGQYWVHDNLEFHGAGPGRWAARGFQMHNLPRFKLKDPEPWVVKFKNGELIEDPVGIAKGLIRPMIKAPEDHVLMVLDYDSIENKILHWVADDQPTLQDFRDGVDQYITMAAARYGEEYAIIQTGVKDEVAIYKGMRQMGKVIILGCGFGMGWETFVATAKTQFGMIVTEEEARAAVTAYRNRYPLVKQLWNDLKNAAVRAVLTGKRQTVGMITFGLGYANGIPWLAMKLPNGKCVYYCKPSVEARHIPRYEEMGKVPTIIHWGRHPKIKKWMRIPLIPGRITENAVQGTAREAMAQGMLNVRERMPHVKLIGTVHDEALALVHKSNFTEDTMKEYAYNLCDISWAKGCPITASGYSGLRYKKD